MEVTVVGGGIIGLSIAWELARRDVAVAVYDAGAMGAEASGAAAGMLAPGGEYDGPGEWTAFALHSLKLYPKFVEDLERESGLTIDYRECGALEMAGDDAKAEALMARAARQAEAGIESVAWPRTGNRVYPGDALVNPRDMVAALRVACSRRGVQLVEHSRVTAIRPDQVTVLAAGAWSSAICEGVPESFPVRGHLISFEQPPGVVPGIIRQGHTYLLQRAGGELIAGASSELVGFDRAVDSEVAAKLAGDAAKIMPSLRGLPFKAWTGLRPGSACGHPVIGRHEQSNLWLAYGHYRNGVLLAPATAERIADSLLESLPRLRGAVTA